MKILLVGFGDIASRLAPRLSRAGHKVSGMRRTPVALQAGDSLTMLAGDCRDPEALRNAMDGQDIVVYTLTPPAFTEEGYRDSYVRAAETLRSMVGNLASPPRHLFWVSSTSVYGQHQGEPVNEQSPTEPRGFSGHYLLQAEQTIAECGIPSTVVRFSGIYGPGRRRLIEQVQRGETIAAHPLMWSNRIHVEDCVGVLSHLIGLVVQGRALEPLYIGTDSEPVPLQQVHQWLAARLGVTLSKVKEAPVSRGNRRCSNQRLRDTGYSFAYPTFREGYGQEIDEKLV